MKALRYRGKKAVNFVRKEAKLIRRAGSAVEADALATAEITVLGAAAAAQIPLEYIYNKKLSAERTRNKKIFRELSYNNNIDLLKKQQSIDSNKNMSLGVDSSTTREETLGRTGNPENQFTAKETANPKKSDVLKTSIPNPPDNNVRPVESSPLPPTAAPTITAGAAGGHVYHDQKSWGLTEQQKTGVLVVGLAGLVYLLVR